jgi:aminoglycoside phosphotransferase (APT) family kinase protein
MHADEVDTDVGLVCRLLAAQFPQWADLPIEPVESAGTDNALYRLGADVVVRLPRIDWAGGQPDKEHAWLPRLAPLLPLAIPAPLALGTPGEGYPWHWSVYRWLDGETATLDRIADPCEAATALGQFVAALHRIEPAGGPVTGEGTISRGGPLAQRDGETRAAIASVRDMFATDALTAAWEDALAAPLWHGPPVWLHGDLQSGNLLAVDGRLSAVIDWGCLDVGDPACDVMPAWSYLPEEARDAFRAALPVDDATWARGRGWALSVGLIALPYYETTNPVLAGIARRSIDAVLADQSTTLG